MPKPKLTKSQAQKISKGCMQKFFRELDSCLDDQILTPDQCLRDAAGQWAACMKANGVTIATRSKGRSKPKRRGAVKRAGKRA